MGRWEAIFESRIPMVAQVDITSLVEGTLDKIRTWVIVVLHYAVQRKAM